MFHLTSVDGTLSSHTIDMVYVTYDRAYNSDWFCNRNYKYTLKLMAMMTAFG